MLHDGRYVEDRIDLHLHVGIADTLVSVQRGFGDTICTEYGGSLFGRFKPIDWVKAFALIAAELNRLDSPKEAEFYTSGRASNEAAFLYQLFARAYGTNNFPNCSNMCHEATGVRRPLSIGVGKGTVTLEDFDHADAILSFEHNPGKNHARMMTTP